MTRNDYWSPLEFAELIDVSQNYLRSRLYKDKIRIITVGHKHIIRKREFFTWYKNGGKNVLDKAFPNSVIAHNSIENAMTAYYMSFYRNGGGCGQYAN